MTDFSHLRDCTVPEANLARMVNIASCPKKRCVYIVDSGNKCIHRLGLDGWMNKWPLRGHAALQSVTQSSNLLFIGSEAGNAAKLMLISSESGECLHEFRPAWLDMDGDACMFNAVQISDSQYIVCYLTGETAGVIRVGSDGSVLQRSDDGTRVTSPHHMVADRDRFVFVADSDVNGVVMFDPSLKIIREIKLGFGMMPMHLHLDEANRRLYVGGICGKVIIVQL